MRMKEESEKAVLKPNIQNTKIMASHHFMANRWGNDGNSGRFPFCGLQNHWRVTAAMKLKDKCSLGRKL